LEIRIRITSQAIIPEIEMVQPKVARLRLYNAKTWRYIQELDYMPATPITRTTTVEGVDGTIAWCANIVDVDSRPTNLDRWSIPLNR
jgi:hypothetical protein